jgi:hypothetical protein
MYLQHSFAHPLVKNTTRSASPSMLAQHAASGTSAMPAQQHRQQCHHKSMHPAMSAMLQAAHPAVPVAAMDYCLAVGSLFLHVTAQLSHNM